MATRLRSVVQVLHPDRIRKGEPKQDAEKREEPSGSFIERLEQKLPKGWSGPDPWEGFEMLAQEDLAAFQEDFQRRSSRASKSQVPTAPTSKHFTHNSERLTSGLSTASTFSGTDCGSLQGELGMDLLDFEEEDHSWEDDFMTRLEEMSKKESQKQGPARHLGREHLIAAKAKRYA